MDENYIKLKTKIKNLLMKQFTDVYCDTCYGNENEYEHCEDCHRKNMEWCISHKTADNLAKEIINIINGI